ncbi:bifunctional nuclease family protein [Parenemella sanctibonifatiensis]|uniref:BFN domain-containing protein n=1 Tax=Parenemella sanctibonifatiensis TaxID=2016505 RepID=A0A255EE35_9ACTN|nr:bifunctional nuclease family protein [Parenemella sanctibonifatiensis]OYN86383.1 hypothetical protein CGZ92_08485 [Parenemella sanctibonifatiensis]
MVELEVMGVRIEMPANAPMVLLRDQLSKRHLVIWVGSGEAAAIAQALDGLTPPRPLTHDLIVDLLEELDHNLTEVRITDLDAGTFFAELVVDDGRIISCRPSDAIAIALRAGVPVNCAEEVLAEAGIELADDADDEGDDPIGDEEVEAFREFLDHVNPDDFVTGEEPDD